MALLEFLRKKLFWTMDLLSRGGVKKHYKDIAFILENLSDEKSIALRQQYVSELLKHAKNNVPFYSDKLENFTALSDFPIIDKTIVRSNFDTFKSANYSNEKGHAVVTSGSTGNPFKILQDYNKRNRSTADTIYFAKKAGFEIGSRLYYFRLWDKQYKKSNLTSLKQNVVMHSVDDFNDEYLAKVMAQLKKDSSSKGILGYVSGLQSICKYLDKMESKPLTSCKVKSIISIAESLDEYTRTSLKKYFGVKVISRYSNSENGIIAQQTLQEESTFFEINWASYFVEVLEMHEDVPVADGGTGRMVVTDLFNYKMPLIRYDTGDVVSVSYNKEDSSKPMVLTKVEGRKLDMFTNTKGSFISPHIIHQILQFDEIDQFQFIQEDLSEYRIKLKLFKNFDYANEEKLIKIYQDYFGSDAKITIEYVNDIPLLLSGKRKLVINNAIANFSSENKKKDDAKEVTSSYLSQRA